MPRLRTDGKFFRADGGRVWLRAVTYGPFPGGWPDSFEPDFRRIAEAGFNAIRLFELPDESLLDAAQCHGLRVFAGLMWGQNADFFRSPALFASAKVAMASSLRVIAAHPALGRFNPLARVQSISVPTTGYHDVRLVALARIALPSVAEIEVDWQQYGPKLAQVALMFGANRLDRVSPVDDPALGPRRATVEEVRRSITAAGFRPGEAA